MIHDISLLDRARRVDPSPDAARKESLYTVLILQRMLRLCLKYPVPSLGSRGRMDVRNLVEGLARRWYHDNWARSEKLVLRAIILA